MKIGIFGGSFNPIHLGHIKMIEVAIKKLNLDKILIIPVGIPSHRENNLVSGKERINMCKLALKNIPQVEVSSIEIDNKEVSYTYDTLIKVKDLYPKDEIFEIIGEDSANYFHKWKKFQEILKLSQVVVFRRKESLYKENLYKEKMVYIEAPYYNYSSTEIRKKIKLGENLEDFLPREIIYYIEQKKLYKN